MALGTATAAAMLVDPPNSCAGSPNCKAMAIQGRVVVDEIDPFFHHRVPFVTQVLAETGECLRLDLVRVRPLTISFPDLLMVVVAPNGTTWRSDDREGGGLNPLIKLIAPAAGFYTVHVTNIGDGYDAGTGQPVDFELKYGRYASAAGHCDDPTPEM